MRIQFKDHYIRCQTHNGNNKWMAHAGSVAMLGWTYCFAGGIFSSRKVSS